MKRFFIICFLILAPFYGVKSEVTRYNFNNNLTYLNNLHGVNIIHDNSVTKLIYESKKMSLEKYKRKIYNYNYYSFSDKIYSIKSQEIVISWYNDEATAMMLLLHSTNNKIIIKHLYVSKKHRRKGISKSMFSSIFEFYKNHHFILDVSKSNQPAINLYIQLGFKVVHEYQGESDLTIVMERSNLSGF